MICLTAVICLLLALQFGGSKYPWSDARVIVLLTVSGVLLVCFVAFEYWMKENASVPVRIIKEKNVAFGALFVFLLDGGFYVVDYYVYPLYPNCNFR